MSTTEIPGARGFVAHPAAAAFPMMSDAELAELADDIREHGLIEPVVMCRQQVLDGRNRLAACELAGEEPEFRQWEGDEGEVVAWIVSKNVHRRHLTAGQRAAAAAELAKLPHGGDRASGTRAACSTPTQAEAAKLLGVSERAVRGARAVLGANPELHEQVKRGEVSLRSAEQSVRPETSREARERRARGELAAGFAQPTPATEEPAVEDDLEGEDADPVTDEPGGQLEDLDSDVELEVQALEAARPETEDEPPLHAAGAVSDRADYDGDSWSTPDDLIEDARAVLGGIDLDPATNAQAQARIQAAHYHTIEDDGLAPAHAWFGRVWLNPPYSRPEPFTTKLVESYDDGRVDAALLLVNNATDTKWFQALLQRFPVCFLAGRVSFLYENGKRGPARQGQAVFYLGDVDRFVEVFSVRGTVVRAVGPVSA